MGACAISGASDKEGGSCDGKEKKFSEVLGERTKEVCLVHNVRPALGNGVYTWNKGTGDKSYGFCV